MRTRIYAIFDKVANDLFGGQHALLLTREDAAAVRIYTELLADPKTIVGKYPKDHDLLFLGYLEEDHCVTPADDDHKAKVILTGEQWVTMNTPEKLDVPAPEPIDPHDRIARDRAIREQRNARS